MRQLKYNDSSQSVRLEFPDNWSAPNVSAVTITVTSAAGTAIVSAASATLYTATTLNALGSAGATTITLAGTATAVASGDRLEIAASAAGPAERVEVSGYSASTKIATLKRPLVYDHTSGTAVAGRWATYALDTSSTSNYPLGDLFTLYWTCGTGDYPPVIELAEVVTETTLLGAFREKFRDLFPAEYRVIETRWDVVFDQAHTEVWQALRARNLELDRLVDEDAATPVLLRYVRWLALESQGDAAGAEREVAWNAYTYHLELLCVQPFWVDADQDKTQDDEEYADHDYVFSRGL
jgi:hypothetical protein